MFSSPSFTKGVHLRYKILVAILLSFVFLHLHAHAQSCTALFPSGTAAPGGYGASWNVFSTAKELLLNGTCSGDTVNVSIGSDQPNQYVFNQGFYWNGTQWRQLSLTGANPPTGSWLARQGKASFAKGTQDPAIFVGYVCQFTDNAWKCGCADAVCTTPRWQVQALQTQTSGGGGGGNTSGLENPPTMDAGYVLIENVCPGESGWPSSSQVAGKDVKIVMPKNRECKPSSDTAAIQGTESNPVKDVWIVGGVLRGAGFSFRNYSGMVFIEGAIIDLAGKCQDAINGYFGRGDGGRWVVQNTHITGVSYCSPGIHGDITHPQGSGAMLNELKWQNVWAHVVRQGFFIVPRTSGDYPGHGLKKLTLDHVFLDADPKVRMAGKQIATMIYWAESWGPPVDGVHFNDTYLRWWGGADGASKSMRKDITIPNVASYDSSECATYASSAKVTGKWCAGAPPGGNTFVPLDKIGLNYNRSNFTK